MKPLLVLVPLSLLLASRASAFSAETIKETRTVPIDLRVTVPVQPRFNAPALLDMSFYPTMSQSNVVEAQRLAAIAPVATVPTGPAPGSIFNADPGAKTQDQGVESSLEGFAGAVAKDRGRGGGKTGSLSGTFFDAQLALPENQAIPHAEGVDRIAHELEAPPELLRSRGIQATVSIYGSARILPPEKALAQYKEVIETHGRRPKTPQGREALKAAREAVKLSQYYSVARRLGELVARGGRGKVAVVTGGGPGIMEAANRGAFEAGGPSVGFNIKLEREQSLNPYVTPGLSFEFQHFASREISLRHGALGMVFFPGGFGTMDEFFEIITLMQTGKIARRPIVLVGEKAYWDQILDFKALAKMGMISPKDLELFRYAETAEDAWAIVRGQR
ncbi:MAG: TIGR00730 family Rossman fold protein [Elusimicrobia bacterium]|nr:TIGR00730 family Rossman fold protein [Elusimicrobiota bacterium]